MMNESIRLKLKEVWSLRGQGRYEAAGRLLAETEKHCAADDHLSLGRIFHIYMQFECDHKRWKKAMEYSEKSLTYYHQSGNLERVAQSLRHQADILRNLDALDRSERLYRRSLDIYRSEFANRQGDLANALRGYALLLEALGKIDVSIGTWQEVKEIYASVGIAEGVDEASLKIKTLGTLLK